MQYSLFDERYTNCQRRVITALSEKVVETFYVSVLISQPLGDVIDGGANVGKHTAKLALLLAGTPQKVVAVEPNTDLHPIIRANCNAELVYNFVIDPHALSNRKTTAKFRVYEDAQISQLDDVSVNGEKLLKAHEHSSSPIMERLVDCVRLRDIVEKYRLVPKFIKLDTEQTEYGIVTESIDLLKRHGVSLSVETGNWSVPAGKMPYFFNAVLEAGMLWIDCLGLPYTRERFEYSYDGIFWNRFIVPREVYNKVDFVTPLWANWCTALQLPLSHLVQCREYREATLQKLS